MKKQLSFAIGIQVAIMLLVFVAPLLTIASGETVHLKTQQVDPRALIRGDYVILRYEMEQSVPLSLSTGAYEKGSLIYVVVTTGRPAKFVSASIEKPRLSSGQACLKARGQRGHWEILGGNVTFPQISQYFVPEGEGMDIQRELNQMVAELKVTKGCNAVVRGLELL